MTQSAGSERNGPSAVAGPSSMVADVVNEEILLASDVQPPAADHGMRQVGVGRLLLQLELTHHVESRGRCPTACDRSGCATGGVWGWSARLAGVRQEHTRLTSTGAGRAGCRIVEQARLVTVPETELLPLPGSRGEGVAGRLSFRGHPGPFGHRLLYLRLVGEVVYVVGFPEEDVFGS
jgi:hypothetical protein